MIILLGGALDKRFSNADCQDIIIDAGEQDSIDYFL